MLPPLGALSLGTPTGAKDDVVTKIRDEQVEADKKAWEAWHEEQEEEEALGPQLEELRAKERALRETYRSEQQAAIVRKEVFDNEDLVKEVLLALEQGDDAWDVCKMVARWCSLNKARRAACDDDFYSDLGERIWGDTVHAWWLGVGPDDRFREMCLLEHAFRTGERTLQDNAYLQNVKRIVLAAIAARSASLENEYNVLAHASEELRDDEDVVRAAVAKDPRSIRFASPRLQALINPLRPTFFWPLGSLTAAQRTPSEFERQWGDAALRILLYGNWSELTVKKIWIQLENEHPEVGLNYFRGTRRAMLGRLVDRLHMHIRENMHLGAS